MTQAKIRILIVDDHGIVRLGLASLFESVPHFVVVGSVGTASAALVEVRRGQPDVVVMDVRLPDESGVDACRVIRAEHPATRVLMLTSYSDEEAVVSSVIAGASGYLLKESAPERLIEAVETIARGGSLLDPSVTVHVLEQLRREAGGPKARDPLGALSEQERKMLPLIADGKTNREIAASLYLSEHTVKTYVSSMLRKLRLSRRVEAAALMSRLERNPD